MKEDPEPAFTDGGEKDIQWRHDVFDLHASTIRSFNQASIQHQPSSGLLSRKESPRPLKELVCQPTRQLNRD